MGGLNPGRIFHTRAFSFLAMRDLFPMILVSLFSSMSFLCGAVQMGENQDTSQ